MLKNSANIFCCYIKRTNICKRDIKNGYSVHKMKYWAIKRFPNTFFQCRLSSHSEHNRTIDKEEIDKFGALCHSWWDEGGSLKALHTLNNIRIPLIRDGLMKQVNSEECLPSKRNSKPLAGLKILDVGCGGGLLSEPLARLGAEVTGIDASKENVEAAAWHATLDKDVQEHVQYMAIPVEDISQIEYESFDGVVASEIIEHVANPDAFINACCDLVKPGGSLFLTTLNKTWLSWALAVIAAERILKIVPAGAHDWNKFVPSATLVDMVTKNNFDVKLVHGMTMNPLTLQWKWIGDTSINYAIHARKDLVNFSDTSDEES